MFSVLIALFFHKIERLSWAFVCLQMLSPVGKGAIFGSLTVKVDTVFFLNVCVCSVSIKKHAFKYIFANEWNIISYLFPTCLYGMCYDLRIDILQFNDAI